MRVMMILVILFSARAFASNNVLTEKVPGLLIGVDGTIDQDVKLWKKTTQDKDGVTVTLYVPLINLPEREENQKKASEKAEVFLKGVTTESKDGKILSLTKLKIYSPSLTHTHGNLSDKSLEIYSPEAHADSRGRRWPLS
jgi:hypothetical protein